MAEAVETILLQLNLNADQIVQALQTTRSEVERLKKVLKEQNDDLKLLDAAGKSGGVAYDNLKKSIIETEVSLKALNAQESNYLQILGKTERANKEDADSYEQKNAALIAGTRTLKLYSDEQIAASEELTALKTNVAQLNEELKTSDKQIGNNQRNVGNYADGFKTFRQEIKQSTDELKNSIDKFGAQSKEAQNAKQKLSDLKDQQKDLNRELESFQPEGKFAAFAKTASGVAGGFAAMQGAVALFGAENEEANKALLKVQSTMAIFQGLKAFSELGKDLKVLLPLLGIQTLQTKAAAVANVELAGAEGEAAAGAEALGVATKTALGPISLIVAGVAVAITLFTVLSASGKTAIEGLTEAVKAEDEAHKQTLETIKEKGDALITEAENELALAQAQKKSAEEVQQLQIDLLNAKNNARRQEFGENHLHLDLLKQQQDASNLLLLTSISGEERKKEEERNKSLKDQILGVQARNAEIANENKKAQEQLLQIQIEGDQKIKDEANKLASLKIATIKDDNAREIAAIKQNTKAQLDAILDTEADASEKRKAIRLKGEDDLAQAIFNQEVKTLQVKNQLTIDLTKEGTLQRIAAEIAAERSNAAKLVLNTKITEDAKNVIRAESASKIKALEDERLQFIQEQNNKELELAKRKADALIEIEKAEAGTDQTKLLAAHLHEIQVNLDAEIQAKQTAANKENEIAHQTITDHEELAKRIKEIDDTLDAEQFAAIKKSAEEIKTATHSSNSEIIQDILAQRQAEVEAASPQEEYAARLALLKEQEVSELNAVGLSEAHKDALRRKYSKLRESLDEENNKKALTSLSSTLGTASSLFKKGTTEYKAFASAQAIIDTYASAVAAYKAVAGVPIVGPVLAVGAAAAAVVAGLLNVAKINTVQAKHGTYLNDPLLPGNETSDSIPANLSKGESVINARSTRMFLPLLSKINELGGGVPFASGGIASTTASISSLRGRFGSMAISGFASGGIPDQSFTYITQQNGQQVIDEYQQQNIIIRAMQLVPAPILTVEDYRTADQRVTTVESRANI